VIKLEKARVLKECNMNSKYVLVLYLFFVIYIIFIVICNYSTATKYNATINGTYSYHIENSSLIVDVGICVYNPDEYSLTASLYDTNNKEIAWSIAHENFSAGSHIMHLNFKIVEREFALKALHLSNLKLTSGSSDRGLSLCDVLPKLYYPIEIGCNLTNITHRLPKEIQFSGVGYGDILLKFTITDRVSVLSSSYSYDIVGIRIPPISSTFDISFPSITKNLSGYAYDANGVYIPNMPNNFSVSITRVKNLNIGLKKQQGSYENTSSVWTDKYTRAWISSQALADKEDVAKLESYLISPGIYQAKIFGDAAENVSQVNLTMTLVKKIIVNGRFNLSINTTGFPSGRYSITAKALNGTFSLDELEIGDSINT